MMARLDKLHCDACNSDSIKLSQTESEKLLAQLEGWEIIQEFPAKKLKITFHTENYVQSMAFATAVAELAESTGHHPQLVIEYSSVTVLWWTHAIQGLHKNDFIMAAKTSMLF
jgi:4a-hydroxytetrahydrobiopterin dehydratase